MKREDMERKNAETPGGDYVNDGILDPAQTLDGEPGEDPLDRGVTVPDHWSTAQRYGTTGDEQREGETLDQLLWEEEPDPALDVDAEYTGAAEPRARRLEADDARDGEPAAFDLDDGSDAGPEETAMTVKDEDDAADLGIVEEATAGETLTMADSDAERDFDHDQLPHGKSREDG
ncbi:hypothetical protein [Actinomadura flavalba]|uniref:hypothetical protein n=1 Tax=Actinomadura flavalba TaxID=1120938 RepID=UPI0003711302|nr:hypothetical protein [Actinomadura flavalba]